MALSAEMRKTLWKAREERQTQEFREHYHAKVNQTREHCERISERREPSPQRMSEVFNF
jgi:hypothetical protein